MHRPVNEFENLLERIKSNSELNTSVNKNRIDLKKTENFLKDILVGKFDNKYEKEKDYLKKLCLVKN